MKTGTNLKKRQGGAVAVIVGLSIVLLVGFLALVMDLARVYLARTGLQNAADAAALSGAKQLDGTAAGICCGPDSSVAWAILTGGGPIPGGKPSADGNPNNLFFGSDLSQTQVDVGAAATSNNKITFSASPDGPWVSIASAQSSPSDKFFVKVDTASGTIAPLFAGVWDIFNLGTFGTAVAGPIVVDITPVGICELPDDKPNPAIPVHLGPGIVFSPDPPPAGYELGYERGVTYKVSDANPLGPGTAFWIDPTTAVAPGPSACSGSVPVSLPYICAGKIAFTPVIGGQVYTNTGVTTPQLNALDSRFDQYPPPGRCDPTTAPPDSNIRQYRCTNAAGSGECLRNSSTAIGLPRDWMASDPGQQSILFTTIGGINQPVPWASRTFANYGPLWSGSRPVAAITDTTDAAVSARWGAIPTTQGFYHAPPNSATAYPQPSPYAQTTGNFILAPGNPARAGRRIINIVIIECLTGPGICRPGLVKGVGRFFMTRQAVIPGADNDIYGEFTGLLPASLLKKQFVLYH